MDYVFIFVVQCALIGVRLDGYQAQGVVVEQKKASGYNQSHKQKQCFGVFIGNHDTAKEGYPSKAVSNMEWGC